MQKSKNRERNQSIRAGIETGVDCAGVLEVLSGILNYVEFVFGSLLGKAKFRESKRQVGKC